MPRRSRRWHPGLPCGSSVPGRAGWAIRRSPLPISIETGGSMWSRRRRPI
jgi:hypothetical protein